GQGTVIPGLRRYAPSSALLADMGSAWAASCEPQRLPALFRLMPESAGVPTRNPLHCAQFDAPHPELPWWITAAAERKSFAPPGPSPLAHTRRPQSRPPHMVLPTCSAV